MHDLSISWLPGLTGFAVNFSHPIQNRYLDSLGAIRASEYKTRTPQARCTMTVVADGYTINMSYAGCTDHELMQLEFLRLAIAFTWLPPGTTTLPMNRTRHRGKFVSVPPAAFSAD